MLTLVLGSYYAISVFVLPLEHEFGWSRLQTSWVTTIGFSTVSLWMLLAGIVLDRKGVRLVAAIGGALYSLAFLLATQIHSLSSFYLTLGLCAGIGTGFGYIAPMAAGAKWFPDKRGLIVGVMLGGSGAGSGLFAPIATRLIEQAGWRSTCRTLAIIFFVITSLATWLIKDPGLDFQPPGRKPSAKPAAPGYRTDISPGQMLRTATFWALWFAYCMGATAGLMVISQLVPFVRGAGHGSAIAAFAVTTGALGNTSGRILSGWLSDYAGRLNTLRLVLLISGAAMPALYLQRRDVTLLYALLAMVYYCYGTQLSVYASTSADFFGTKFLGLNYGLLFTAWGAAGIIGPFLAGVVYSATGEYRWAFYIASGLSLLALAMLNFARPAQSEKTIERAVNQ